MTDQQSQTAVVPEADRNHPRSRKALRAVRLLVAAYVVLSVLTLVAAYLLRSHHSMVTDTVWIRGGIVAVTSLLMLTFAAGTARGRHRAYLRLRIVSAVMVVAIAVLVSLPGLLPLWMRIEQGVCGLILIGVVLIANGRQLRSLFSTR